MRDRGPGQNRDFHTHQAEPRNRDGSSARRHRGIKRLLPGKVHRPHVQAGQFIATCPSGRVFSTFWRTEHMFLAIKVEDTGIDSARLCQEVVNLPAAPKS